MDQPIQVATVSLIRRPNGTLKKIENDHTYGQEILELSVRCIKRSDGQILIRINEGPPGPITDEELKALGLGDKTPQEIADNFFERERRKCNNRHY